MLSLLQNSKVSYRKIYKYNFGCVYPHFHKINIYGTKQTFESTALQTTLYKKRDKKIVKNLKFKDKINKALILNDFILSIKLKK